MSTTRPALDPRSAPAALALIATLAAGGCVDTTPIVVEAEQPVTSDGGPFEAGDGADVELGPCQVCLEAPGDAGPGCGEQLGACYENERCKLAIDCASAKGCFEKGSAKGVTACGLPCGIEAGMASADDPAITVALAVFACIQNVCAPACGLTE